MSRNPNRHGSLYVFSAERAVEQMGLKRQVLARKVKEYDRRRQEIEALAGEDGITDSRDRGAPTAVERAKGRSPHGTDPAAVSNRFPRVVTPAGARDPSARFSRHRSSRRKS